MAAEDQPSAGEAATTAGRSESPGSGLPPEEMLQNVLACLSVYLGQVRLPIIRPQGASLCSGALMSWLQSCVAKERHTPLLRGLPSASCPPMNKKKKGQKKGPCPL